jgi:hypothetical protein
MRGFILVGGSALALHLRHRMSEDLDLAYLGDVLPRDRLNALTKTAENNGFTFVANDNPAALDEFLIGGLELRDYQQDYLVNHLVKVSFFAPSHELEKILTPDTSSDRIRVASVQELFRSKCLVSAQRSKTRDWLDLYILMRYHGFSIADYREAFVAAGVPSNLELSLARLCSGVPQSNDEGFSDLLQNPPSVEEMRDFFREERNRLEQLEAANALKNAASRSKAE